MIKQLNVDSLNLRLLRVERDLKPLAAVEPMSLTVDVQKRIQKLRTSLALLRKEFNQYRAKHERMGEKERDKTIQAIITSLSERTKQTAFDFAVTSYDSLFFKSISDPELKIMIAKQLLQYFGTGYAILLWKNIAENNPAVFDLLYEEAI